MTIAAADASGNGNDGTYAAGVAFVSGLIPGNGASQVIGPTVAAEAVDAPLLSDPFGGNFTIVVWVNLDITNGGNQTYTAYLAFSGGGVHETIRLDGNPTLGGFNNQVHLRRTYAVGSSSDFFASYGTGLLPNGAVMIAVSYVAATGTPTFFVNGTAYALAGFPSVHAMTLVTDTQKIALAGSAVPEIWDEVAIFPTALSSGDIASLYAARSDFGTYDAAVLARSPAAYYHMDGPGGWHVDRIGMGA